MSDRERSSRSSTCPDDRVVVLGLVSSKQPRLETAEDITRRVKDAARYVSLDRLALSPQCGFASTHEGNRLSADDQRQKLELVARTAKEIWGLAVDAFCNVARTCR